MISTTSFYTCYGRRYQCVNDPWMSMAARGQSQNFNQLSQRLFDSDDDPIRLHIDEWAILDKTSLSILIGHNPDSLQHLHDIKQPNKPTPTCKIPVFFFATYRPFLSLSWGNTTLYHERIRLQQTTSTHCFRALQMYVFYIHSLTIFNHSN